MKFISRNITGFALILCMSTCGRVVLAQDNSHQGQVPGWPQQHWSNAHNQWQPTPIDISKQTDTVTPDVRAKRNAYWMHYPQQMTLRTGPTLPPVRVLRPEVGKIAGTKSIWVVATFEGVHVFALDPDSATLYTEMNMRVVKVIKSPDGFPVSAGSLLDVLIVGGSLKTARGAVHEFRVEPHSLSAQPGHTYLLRLLYDPDYGIITPFQRWEISSGRLVPEMKAKSAEHSKVRPYFLVKPLAKQPNT
jgi:hypothetical protein